jgi:hypothetical protein
MKRISLKDYTDDELIQYAKLKYPIGDRMAVELVGKLGNLSPVWLTRKCGIYKIPLIERAKEHLKRYTTFDRVKFLRWAKSVELPPTSLSMSVLNDLSNCELNLSTNFEKFVPYHRDRLSAKIDRVRDRLPDYPNLLEYALPPELLKECELYKAFHPDFDINYFDYFYSTLQCCSKKKSLVQLLFDQHKWMIDNTVELMA